LSLKEEKEKLDSVLPDNRRRRRESSLLGQNRFAQPNRHVLRAALTIVCHFYFFGIFIFQDLAWICFSYVIIVLVRF
jgi:hypothetical protein